MCEPTTIMMGVGALTSAAGTLMGASQQAQGMKDRANLIARQGGAESYAASVEAENLRTQNELRQGAARAAFAASGVDPSTGTPMDVARSMDKENIDETAKIIWGADLRRENAMLEASSGKRGAKDLMTAGAIGAVGDTIGTFTDPTYLQSNAFKRARENVASAGRGLFNLGGA